MKQLRESLLGFASCLLAAASVGLLALPALAIIKPNTPPYQVYLMSSAAVVGDATAVDAAAGTAQVKVAGVLKGTFAPAAVTVTFKDPADLVKSLKAGDKFIMFIARRTPNEAVLHFADTWLLANQDGAADKWTVTKSMQDMGWSCFPGRTWQLAKHIEELKVGKPTMLVGVDHNLNLRTGEATPVAAKPGAAAVVTADVNGDGKSDILVAGMSEMQLMLNDGKGEFADATAAWGLAGAKGDKAAAGNINGDGKADLLVGDQLYLNAGGKFAADQKVALPPRSDLFDVVIADVNGDGKADVAALKKDGEAVGFLNPGAAGKPWAAMPARKIWSTPGESVQQALFGDWNNDGKLYVMTAHQHGVERYGVGEGSEAFADYTRLTGRAADGFPWGPKWGNGLESISHLLAGDFDKDGRKDLFVLNQVGKTRGTFLPARGFGTYFENGDPPNNFWSKARFKTSWGGLTPEMLVATGDFDGDRFTDVVVYKPAGTLYVCRTEPAAFHPAPGLFINGAPLNGKPFSGTPWPAKP